MVYRLNQAGTTYSTQRLPVDGLQRFTAQYDTTNIHLLIISDFEKFCRTRDVIVEQLVGLRSCATGASVKHFSEFLVQGGIFAITKRERSK